LLLHRDEVVDGSHKESPTINNNLDSALTKHVNLIALAHEKVDFGASVWRAKVQCQHSLLLAPPPDLFDVADTLQWFGYARPTAQRPEEVNRRFPGLPIQAWNDIEIEGHAGTAVQGRSNPPNDHEVNLVVVKSIQDFEKVACHVADSGRCEGL
jgi:hypothetical protein